MVEPIASFGEWVRRQRRALDLTRDALARQVGCATVTIKKIELDERRPSVQVAELLAKALHITEGDRPLFVQVARGERAVDNLSTPHATPPRATGPAIAPPAPPPSRLPVPMTPLVGREAEMAQLAWLLQDPTCRLLTLVGPGGIGKTRLAVEAATARREHYPDGVFFVSLASLGSSDFIISTIAQALGYTFYGTDELNVQFFRYLQNKEKLLVLDNFEHLLEGAFHIGDLLSHAGNVTVLVTSREQLNLPGEWVYEVHGLPLPDPAWQEGLHENSAVELFVQCARRARGGFTPREEELPAAARICKMVGGMPLGIELAAAWVRTLSCEEIATEISRTFDFLAVPSRNVPERHRSIRAVFDYSWQLLAPEEQGLLCRLSIFQGRFTREAATKVAGASLPLLSTLVDKSLVRRTPQGSYSLHELIRQYAHARLATTARNEQALRQRHMAYFADWMEDAERRLKSPLQPETLAEISTRLGDIHIAFQHAAQTEAYTALWKLVPALAWFYEVQGYFREGASDFGQAVTTLREAGVPETLQKPVDIVAFAGLLDRFGWFLFRTGYPERSSAILEESLLLAEKVMDPVLLAYIHTNWAFQAVTGGDLAGAEAHTHAALASARELEWSWYRAVGLSLLGIVTLVQGHVEAAYQRLHDSLLLWREVGEPRGLLFTLNYLSGAASALDRIEEAHAALEECVTLSAATGDRWGQATATRLLGEILLDDGAGGEALARFEESLALSQQIGDMRVVMLARLHLGGISYRQGEPGEALSFYRGALHLALELQAPVVQARVLLNMARLHADTPDPVTALALVHLLLDHEGYSSEISDGARKLRATLEGNLTPAQVEAASERAARLTLRAVADATEKSPPA